jgi:uncharacterized protein (TIGR02246 family)
MKKRVTILLAAVAILGGGLVSLHSQEATNKAEDEAILKAFSTLTAAFNGGDAKTLAGLWSEEANYLSAETGERVRGRKAVEKDYRERLAQRKGAHLDIKIESVRRITPEVATAEGFSSLRLANEPPSDHTFTAILVKKNGRWLLDTIRETELPAAASSYEQLKQLEWLVGDWHHKEGNVEVYTTASWLANKNFLSRFFTVAVKGEIVHQGTQIVGWDPLQQRIRSWVFESDGSFGEGTWTRQGKSWHAHVSGVQAGGKKCQATQILTRIDDDHYTFEVVGCSVGGQVSPNLEPVTMVRRKGKE